MASRDLPESTKAKTLVKMALVNDALEVKMVMLIIDLLEALFLRVAGTVSSSELCWNNASLRFNHTSTFDNLIVNFQI